MKRRKICVVTSSRADYGHLYCLMRKIQADSQLKLQIIATGAHISKEFGETFKVIEKDGFCIDVKLSILGGDDSPWGTSEAMAMAIKKCARAFAELQPDILVVLGDRYEIFSAVQAALIAKIPVAHIAGGDTTEGAFDESIRHCITKLSHLHFVTHEEAVRRVQQMGENPAHIFLVGSPSLDYIKHFRSLTREELKKSIDLIFRHKNVLVTFHPPTLDSESAAEQFQELLNALDDLGPNVGIIFTKPNADPSGRELIRMIDNFIVNRSHAKAYASLGQDHYLSLMHHVDAVVGNSSSGLYEAPSFGIPTVNIGDRQKGRVQAASVVDCIPGKKEIIDAIGKAFRMDCSGVSNPYGDGSSAQKIYQILKNFPDPKRLLKKHFFFSTNASSTKHVYVLAEVGVNHNGSLRRAKKLIEVAKKVGADGVKFQTFTADLLVSKSAVKAEYQKRTTDADESQWQMIRKLELSEQQHRELKGFAESLGMEFVSTPFDLESLSFLAESLGLGRLKISSGDITNAPLLLAAARTGLPILLSTGMSTLEEVEEALGVLAFGYTTNKDEKIRKGAFKRAFQSSEGQTALKRNVTLLHCTTEYPVLYADVNLRAMDTLRERFGLTVGLSDHSLGIAVSIAAVARGAEIIEKHFTLDKNLPGPDHRASLEPDELHALVTSIRQVEESFGSPVKGPTASEVKNKLIVRRSLVTGKKIRKGQLFTKDSLIAKRPGHGLSPMEYWEFIGRRAQRDYRKDEMVMT